MHELSNLVIYLIGQELLFTDCGFNEIPPHLWALVFSEVGRPGVSVESVHLQMVRMRYVTSCAGSLPVRMDTAVLNIGIMQTDRLPGHMETLTAQMLKDALSYVACYLDPSNKNPLKNVPPAGPKYQTIPFSTIAHSPITCAFQKIQSRQSRMPPACITELCVPLACNFEPM